MLEGIAPAESVSAVLQAMDCHPTCERTLTQGCLALGNIGRAGQEITYGHFAGMPNPHPLAQ